MDKIEQIQFLQDITNKSISLTEASELLEMTEMEVLGLVHELRNYGINISLQKRNDDIYMLNHGEKDFESDRNIHKIQTDDNNEFKFVAISDTRIGSKSQQLSILNDIYLKAYELGYNNVILCGNISEGLYPLTDDMSQENFLNNTSDQIDYIIANYPHINGITTYFITGIKDNTHLKTNKINLGKRISAVRPDMIYLGHNSSTINIDNVNMLVLCSKLKKTYTVSYRPQQQVASFRSEDKPDVILYGGLLQMDKLSYRNVTTLSVPSVCATTKEMRDKRYNNTIGAWYITLRTDKYGNLASMSVMDSVYYKTNKDDYTKRRVLKINGR